MNWFNESSPKATSEVTKVEPVTKVTDTKVVTDGSTKVVDTPVKEHKVKGARLKEHDVMLFLQTLSQDIKNKETHLPSSISERIDTFIKEHGNLHPETTKNVAPTPM